MGPVNFQNVFEAHDDDEDDDGNNIDDDDDDDDDDDGGNGLPEDQNKWIIT